MCDVTDRYVFISNVDNLGATVDLKILYHLMIQRKTFAMEVSVAIFLLYFRCDRLSDYVQFQVVQRTRADHAGGVFVHYDGHPNLLERALVR